jgi:tetratricopeptide (TPR) repeat protein
MPHLRRSSSRAVALLAALLALLLPGLAAAKRPPAAPAARAPLDTLAGAPDSAAALAAAAALAEIAAREPASIADIEAFLKRPRGSTVEQRRLTLKLVKASVPDDKGKFETPQRMVAEQVRVEDEFDWLGALVKLDRASPGLGDLLADVAAIRALAGSKNVDAGRVIVETAFAPDTLIYRDECGRYLRKMAPYSIPALMVASQAKRDASRRRYATYQLERLDRQDPGKALAAAAEDEALEIAILDAFRATGHREAVHSVLATVDHDSPRVRDAARKAWMAYVTGPPPPPAPKKKLVLTGGRLADKETPLWLTYRELAEIELDKLSEELFGDVPPKGETLEATSKRLFALYDGKRAERDGAAIDAAAALAAKGDLAGAGRAFDQILAVNPEHPRRAEMVETYLALARALQAEGKWADAAAAYSKAHGLAPDGPKAGDALAAHHFALGKSLEAGGKDGSASYRQAVAIKPDYAPARKAVADGATANKRWMLWLSAVVALGALALLIIGLQRRKRA